MNERIKQLAEQATAFARENVEYSRTEGFDIFTEKLYEVSREKFAELIVKECIEQASIGNGHGNNQWDRALTFASKNIKEHFGVKE